MDYIGWTIKPAGFIVHPIKCVWNPKQHLIWLGFVIDLVLGQIQAPDSKIVMLQNMIEQARDISFVRPRYLASMLGKIISMSLAFGPVSRFMTRSLYAVLESRQSWSRPLQFSPDAKAELAFWSSELRAYKRPAYLALPIRC